LALLRGLGPFFGGVILGAGPPLGIDLGVGFRVCRAADGGVGEPKLSGPGMSALGEFLIPRLSS